jgi:hypothetical protein
MWNWIDAIIRRIVGVVVLLKREFKCWISRRILMSSLLSSKEWVSMMVMKFEGRVERGWERVEGVKLRFRKEMVGYRGAENVPMQPVRSALF